MYGHAQYQSAATETAGPAQLVLMLYDGALARIARANEALSRQPADGAAAHDALTAAQAIVHELTVSLDHERGGEVATNLSRLYRFCTDGLIEANVAKDPALLASVTDVLQGLRDAWEQACVASGVAAGVAG